MTPELPLLIALCAPSVHPSTAMHVIQQESAGRPYAIGINGGAKLSRQPTTEAQAVSTAKALIAQGLSVDMGYAQINSKTMQRLGLRVEDVFKPCVNLQAMAAVLTENYRRAARAKGEGQAALQAALSSYNTGDMERGLRNGYVRAIYQRAAR